eukprot:7044325-Pyramimonas_sp.AAC.1
MATNENPEGTRGAFVNCTIIDKLRAGSPLVTGVRLRRWAPTARRQVQAAQIRLRTEVEVV